MSPAVRPIGYYVHHHGAGHRTRARSIARAANGRVTLLGTGLATALGGEADPVPHIDLPDDRRDAGFTGVDGAGDRPEALHYAPIDHAGVRARVARIARWIAECEPALMVVDVSAEIAMLARLASVPTVVVRLAGHRTDAAHLDAFRGARAILCPFAEMLDDPGMAALFPGKTLYLPGLGERPPVATVDPDRIVVALGAGGAAPDAEVWVAAARAVPERRWEVLGLVGAPGDRSPNLEIAGWVDDVPLRIAGAGVVIGSAGNGTITTVLAARRPFVCVPEDRPYGEQRANAAALARYGAAVVCDDPATADWPALIAATSALDPAAAAALDDPSGAMHAATRLIALADAPAA